MAMGLPVIATNWSGPTEFLTDETGWPLRYSFAPLPAEMNLPGHEWVRAGDRGKGGSFDGPRMPPVVCRDALLTGGLGGSQAGDVGYFGATSAGSKAVSTRAPLARHRRP
eukprot:scaffold22980_cov114-Isochrysis_galbana.AAC.1